MEPPNAPLTAPVGFGRFELRAANRQLLLDGQPVVLGARAFDVLLALVERRHRLVTKEELLDVAWPGLVVEENNLSVQISSLRKILGLEAIATLPGRGYQFALDLTHVVAERSAPAKAANHNLPERVTSFIGRETELAKVDELLSDNRLVTLVGPGGIGKTRLSLEIGANAIDDYADGVWLVELAPLSDPRLVPQELARILGVREEPGSDVLSTLVKTLKGKELLLLLDNCEHLVDAAARLCDALIAGCANVRILATSREALRVPGERAFRVPLLAVPNPGASVFESLTQYAAVRLFIDRAVAAQSTFGVDNRNAPAVASICYHLDGIPLAIELAAARVRSMSVHDIHDRLDQRFRLLAEGARTVQPRQRTLRAAIDWSHDLLSADERALLRRLAVFAGGWTLGAVDQLFASDQAETAAAVDLLTSLVDKSLIVFDEVALRYRFLETVHEYARERLVESREETQRRNRHLAHFLALAEEARPHLQGKDQKAWLDRLESEHDNLRAALTHASSPGADRVSGLRLAVAISWFWSVRGYFSEGRSWLTAIVAAVPDGVADGIRARALHGAYLLAFAQSDYVTARALTERSLAISRSLEDRGGIARSLGALGLIAIHQNQHELARTFQEESLSIHRELGSREGAAANLANLANISYLAGLSGDVGQISLARAQLTESLDIYRELGDQEKVATQLHNLGNLAHELGDYATAQAHYEQSLSSRRELGDRWGEASTLGQLGRLVAEQGDRVRARLLLEESLEINRTLGHKRGIALSLCALGKVFSDEGDHVRARALHRESLSISWPLGERGCVAEALEALAACSDESSRAASLWGAAERMRQEIHVPLAPNERSRYDVEVANARAASGDNAAFDEAWQKGRGMTIEEIIEYAREPDAD